MDTSRKVTVKRYTCLWTADLQRKSKRWHDGYIRLHYYNSKIFLLDLNFRVIDESFFRFPPGADPKRFLADAPSSGPLINSTTNPLCQEIPQTVVLPSDEQVDLERHIATIEGLDDETLVDLAPLLDHVQKKHKQKSHVNQDLPSSSASSESSSATTKHAMAAPAPQRHDLTKRPFDKYSATSSSSSFAETQPKSSRRLGTTVPTASACKSLQEEWSKAYPTLASKLHSKQSSDDRSMSISRFNVPSTRRPPMTIRNGDSPNISETHRNFHGVLHKLSDPPAPPSKVSRTSSSCNGDVAEILSTQPPPPTQPITVLSATKGKPDHWDDRQTLNSNEKHPTKYPSSFEL